MTGLGHLGKERGWNRADLAKRARVSTGHVAHLETHRHDPKLSTLVQLAKAFRVPMTELLE